MLQAHGVWPGSHHSLDLQAGIVVAVCARFDLLWHGRIAAAYIQAGQDCFLRFPSAQFFGLHPDQISEGHKAGDDCPPSVLHTAIDTYLGIVAERKIPNMDIFSGGWVNRIHDNLRRGMQGSSGNSLAGSLSVAAQLRNAANWESVVSFAVGFAYKDHNAIQLNDGKFKSGLPNTTNLRIKELAPHKEFEDVLASPLDFFHALNNSVHKDEESSDKCFVFTTTLRHPNVSGIVSLPQDIAALCTKHRLSWPTEEFTLQNRVLINISVPRWCCINKEQLQMKGRLQPQAVKLVKHL